MGEPEPSGPQESPIKAQLLRECAAMARHALASGLEVPPALMQQLEATNRPGAGAATSSAADLGAAAEAANGDEVAQLTRAHTQLAQIVAPATPLTIVLLEDESLRKGLWSFLGPVPLVRRLMLAGMLCLVVVVVTSLSPQVNTETVAEGLLESSGPVLLLNVVFLLAASGLGASFAGLFRANRFVKAGTYNPAHDSSYWILLALGVIAGLILAELVPLGEAGRSPALGKPTLAMVGGFSAQVVYRMLNRLVETVETLVRGRDTDLVEARALAARVRYQQQLIEGRSRLAANLMQLRQQVGGKADADAILSSLDRILQQVAPADLAFPAQPEGGHVKPSGTPPGTSH